MKKLLALTILLISNFCFSQLKTVVIDSETKEKIQYVNIWVENENIGTTSNENGEFELKFDGRKTIVFSAIGFETKRISSDHIENILELKPLVTQLDEIFLNSKKSTEKLIIGKFKESEINHYYACGTKPWITARFFKFQLEYKKTSFLNKIRILTNSNIKDAKFNIRFYGVSDNGEPDGYIYDKNVIGIAKKGNKITEINISDLNIEFPEDGFFIAIEWLIIDSNKYEYDYIMQDSKKKLKSVSYEPMIGTVPAETNENSWIFNQGKWKNVWKNNNGTLKNNKDKYNLLAIELTLTN